MTSGRDKVSTTPAVPGSWVPSLLDTADVLADGAVWPNESGGRTTQECYVASRAVFN